MNAAAMSQSQVAEVTPKDAMRALEYCLARGKNVLLLGEPGAGKTTMVKDVTKRLIFEMDGKPYDLLILHPQIADPTDFKGMPGLVKIADGIDGTKALFIPFGELEAMINADRPLVVFLDDFGQALRAVQAAIQQLILERKVNTHTISKHVRFALAANRTRDMAGVEQTLSTIKTRVRIFNVVPDVDDWCMWASANGVPSECIAFIRFKQLAFLTAWADPRFRPDKNTVGDGNIRTCRTVTEAFLDYADGVPQGMELSFAHSLTDHAWAIEFLAFIKTFRDLPDLDRAYADPDSFVCPPLSKPDVVWATTAGIAARAKKDNADAFFKLVSKLPKDFGAAAVKDAITRDPKIPSTKGFLKWFNNNQDIVLS